MSLKEKILSSYLAFEDYLDDDSPIHTLRNKAIKSFEDKGFPSKKEEAWKYTSLNSLLKEEYSIFPKKEAAVEFKDVKKFFLHEIDTYKIVFVDGLYSSFLSSTTHDGMDICLLSAALSKEKYKPVIEAYFNKAAKEDSLASLNTAFARKEPIFLSPNTKKLKNL